MKKCCVCGAEVTQPFPYPFVCAADEEEVQYGCPVCEQHMLYYDLKPTEYAVRRAVEYFCQYVDWVKDERVKELLNYVCGDEVRRMAVCSVCGAPIEDSYPFVLFIGPQSHKNMYICSECKEQYMRLLEDRTAKSRRQACDYFGSMIERAKEPEVKAHLEFLQAERDNGGEDIDEFSD